MTQQPIITTSDKHTNAREPQRAQLDISRRAARLGRILDRLEAGTFVIRLVINDAREWEIEITQSVRSIRLSGD